MADDLGPYPWASEVKLYPTPKPGEVVEMVYVQAPTIGGAGSVPEAISFSRLENVASWSDPGSPAMVEPSECPPGGIRAELARLTRNYLAEIDRRWPDEGIAAIDRMRREDMLRTMNDPLARLVEKNALVASSSDGITPEMLAAGMGVGRKLMPRGISEDVLRLVYRAMRGFERPGSGAVEVLLMKTERGERVTVGDLISWVEKERAADSALATRIIASLTAERDALNAEIAHLRDLLAARPPSAEVVAVETRDAALVRATRDG